MRGVPCLQRRFGGGLGPTVAKPSRRASALGTSERKREVCAPCGRVIPLPTVRGAPTRETHHAKVNRDDSIAGPGRHFGGDCADGWFAKSIRTTSIDEPGQEIAAGGCTGRPPPDARRSSALGKKPDG